MLISCLILRLPAIERECDTREGRQVKFAISFATIDCTSLNYRPPRLFQFIFLRSHEGLDLYRPVSDPDPSRPVWGENQWPSSTDVPQFQQKYERWVDRMKELGLIVMEA